MNKRVLFTLLAACGTLPMVFVAQYLASAAPHTMVQSAPVVRAALPPPKLFPAVTAPAVVDAANAFLATLSVKQRTVAQIALTPQLAAKWSNFPAGFAPRNGVFFRDMNAKQSAAALKVARLALSADGFKRYQELRATDSYFAKHDKGPGGPGGGPPPGGFGGPPPGGGNGQGGPPPGGFGGPPPGGGNGPGGRGGPPPGFGGPGGMHNLFGAGNYMIAFLGKPSKTMPWLLQLGGHHTAFNIFYKGKIGASTPYFIGVQPNVWKDAQGKTHTPLAPMHDAMYGLTHSLTPSQLAQAKLSQSFNDVYVGPGRDGQFPGHQGVSVSGLSAKSKKWVTQAIAAWTGDTAQGALYRKRYLAELNLTKVAWSGTTKLNSGGDYVRLDGPHLWIEFCCQGTDHYHTIWRDRTTDYGAEFSF